MGHPVLRAVARPLERAQIKSAAVQKLIEDMIDTMVEYRDWCDKNLPEYLGYKLVRKKQNDC